MYDLKNNLIYYVNCFLRFCLYKSFKCEQKSYIEFKKLNKSKAKNSQQSFHVRRTTLRCWCFWISTRLLKIICTKVKESNCKKVSLHHAHQAILGLTFDVVTRFLVRWEGFHRETSVMTNGLIFSVLTCGFPKEKNVSTALSRFSASHF